MEQLRFCYFPPEVFWSPFISGLSFPFERVHSLPGFRREKEPWQPGSTGKKIIKMSPDATSWPLCSQPCGPASCWTSRGKKVNVMERTLNVESGHVSQRLISTSSCIHDPGQVVQLLTTWVPSHPAFNACPTVLREWSFEHWCSGDGQRGGGMSELKHMLQKSLSLSTSLRSCLPLSSLWLPSGIRHSSWLPLSTHFQDCAYHTLIRLNMPVFAAQWQTPLE